MTWILTSNSKRDTEKTEHNEAYDRKWPAVVSLGLWEE